MINRYKWIKVFLLWLKSREILLLPTVRMAPSSIHDQRLGRWLEASNAAKVGVQHPTIKHRHINKIHVLYIYIITHCIYIYVHIISVPQSPKKSKKLPPKIKEKREKKNRTCYVFFPWFPIPEYQSPAMAGRGTSARQGLAAVLRSFARVLKERNEGRWTEREKFHPGTCGSCGFRGNNLRVKQKWIHIYIYMYNKWPLQ